MKQQLTFTELTFTTKNDKLVAATIVIKDDEATVINITINGKFYNRQQCSSHEWLLYKAVKPYWYA